MICSGDLWAGAEAVALELAAGLIRDRNIEVLVVLFNHGRMEELCQNNGIRTLIIDETK